MNVVNNSSVIYHDKETAGTEAKIACKLKKNLHRLYFSENDLSESLPQSSSTSEEMPVATYFEKDKTIVNALTTMVKIANDTIELVFPSRQSKETKPLPRISNIRKSEGPFVNLIDLNTPPMQGKFQKKYIEPREISKEPLTSEGNLTLTYFEKDQIIFNNLTTMIKIANDFIELLSTSTESKETKNLIDVTTPVQSKLQRKYMTPRKILKEPLTLSNSKIPQAKRIGTLKHMERSTRSTVNLSPPQYTSSPKRNLNPSVTRNGVSHEKKLLRSSTYSILPTQLKSSNLSNGRKRSASQANLTITLEK